MRKPDVGIIAGTALLGVAVGCAALIVVNRRRVAKEKRGWLEQIPASTFSSEYARVFKLKDLDRSPHGNLGGADALQCVDTRVDILVGTLVDVPGIVLYSIEVVEGKILFLFMQVPSVPELFETPFLDRGVRALVEIGSIVVVASMDAVEKIPRLTPLDELSAKDQSRYSIVWNTGRCGSTLMHKMLQKIGVLSLSEPYWLDKILELPSQGLDHDEVGRVFCVSAALDVLLVRKWLPAHRPIVGAAATLGSGYVSFNPKGKSVLAMEPIIRSLPNAKHMLMYRDVRKVAESFGSIFNRSPSFLDRVVAFLMIRKPRSRALGNGLRAPPNKRKPTFSKAVAEAEDSGCLKEPAKRMVKTPTVHWVETMCLWKELTENGHLKNASAASLRMEDFVRKLRRAGDKGARPRNGLTDVIVIDPELIEKILRFFLGERLEVGEDAVWLALEAFNKHSQAGDLMAKSSHSGAGVKKFLTPEDMRQIEEYVGAVPCIGVPDFAFSDSMGLQK